MPGLTKPPKIFVVEDDTIQRKAMEYFLRGKGMEVVPISNGLKVLTELESQTPDLIVSDINMPELNGLELLEAMNRRLETKSIPVIFCSAMHGEDIIQKAQRLGAQFFLPKPFAMKELYNLMLKILKIPSAPPAA